MEGAGIGLMKGLANRCGLFYQCKKRIGWIFALSPA
jgi:hypothetical protein